METCDKDQYGVFNFHKKTDFKDPSTSTASKGNLSASLKIYENI